MAVVTSIPAYSAQTDLKTSAKATVTIRLATAAMMFNAVCS